MAELDADMYDMVDGKPQKVSQQEYIDRKRTRIKEEIKRHELSIYMLNEQLEQTTLIDLGK